MAGASYVCDPGAPIDGRYSEEQLAERCARRSCKCERSEHWWGEGPCACGKCDYFRPRSEAKT